MKNTYLALGLAALVVASTAGRASAQGSPAMRVALVNVGQVFSKYDKAKAYKDQMENALKPFKDEGEKIKSEAIKYGKVLQENPKMEAKLKEQYENYLLSLKRKMEDLDMQARKLVGKQQEDQITTLFKDVAAAVQAYAKANGIQMVLGYGEQIEGDLYSFPNVNRKMNGMDLGSTTPLYVGPGIDISQAVIDTLNAQFRAAGGAGTVQGVTTSNPAPAPK